MMQLYIIEKYNVTTFSRLKQINFKRMCKEIKVRIKQEAAYLQWNWKVSSTQYGFSNPMSIPGLYKEKSMHYNYKKRTEFLTPFSAMNGIVCQIFFISIIIIVIRSVFNCSFWSSSILYLWEMLINFENFRWFTGSIRSTNTLKYIMQCKVTIYLRIFPENNKYMTT